MAQARLSVRKIREILRLRAEGFSERDIAGSVGVARSSIQICLWRAERAGVGWPPPSDQDDAALEALLYPRPKPGVEVHPTPDFEWIERELRRKHVTRRQLWREYLARYPDGLKYTAFCVKFQQWRRRRGVTMKGCLPKVARSSGFLWITFLWDSDRRGDILRSSPSGGSLCAYSNRRMSAGMISRSLCPIS